MLVSDPPFDIVLHTASPFNFREGKSNCDFIDPGVKGTTEILNGVTRKGSGVKRVLITSSMAAVIDSSAPPVSDSPKIYIEEDWFEISRHEAEMTDNPVIPYLASKTFAEKATWEFLVEKKPRFGIVTINPPMVYGPIYDASYLKPPRSSVRVT